ncbi:MAG: hypothetical protein ACFFAS_11145 [Promethearchaeota archaeon]
MDVVKFFGPLLAEKTGLKLTPCSGMVRLALRDAGKTNDLFKMNDIKLLINKYLKERLERAGFDKNEEIIKALNLELIKNQSLLLMTARSQK